MNKSQTGTEAGISAVEIARLCGYSSDRWTRDRRAELEEIFRHCIGGKALVAQLKTSSGKYTEWALEQIQALQKATSTAVPLSKNGAVVMVKGKAKLIPVERQMTLGQYTEALYQKYGKLLLEEDSNSEQDPETPGGALDAELIEEDPELISTRLVFQSQEKTAELAQVQDDTAAIAADTYGGLSSLRSSLVRRFGQMGAEIGAEAMQALSLEFQKTVNQGAVDLHDSNAPAEAPKTTRKATKKKL
jgi:hypothetical protein